MRSGQYLGRKAHAIGRPYSSTCLSLGFVDAAAPIIIKGRHIATWMVGQACLADITQERVAAYYREIGADPDEMLQAFASMSGISRQEFETKLEFFWRLCRQFSMLGYTNLKYSKVIDQLEQSRRELEEYKVHLEKIVQKRTEKLRHAREQVEHLSRIDPLTGCFNRQFLTKTL